MRRRNIPQIPAAGPREFGLRRFPGGPAGGHPQKRGARRSGRLAERRPVRPSLLRRSSRGNRIRIVVWQTTYTNLQTIRLPQTDIGRGRRDRRFIRVSCGNRRIRTPRSKALRASRSWHSPPVWTFTKSMYSSPAGSPLERHGVRDPEMVGIGRGRNVVVVGQTVDRTEIVRITPLVRGIDPIGAVARLVVVAGFEACSAQRIALRSPPTQGSSTPGRGTASGSRSTRCRRGCLSSASPFRRRAGGSR